MIKNKKTILMILVVIIAGGVFLFLQNKDKGREISYGVLSNYFTGQESITYPLVFEDIRIIRTDRINSINFGPQKFGDFEIFMGVNKITRKESVDSKSDMVYRGWVLDGEKNTRNGYVGEILSNDLKAHPVTNMQGCSFGYNYYVPLAEGSSDLVLGINFSQSSWGKDGNYSNCQIFEDKNYKYLKSIVDKVIADFQPAF